MNLKELLFFKSLDYFKGLKTYDYFCEFKNTLSFDVEEIRLYQAKKLRNLLNYALKNSKYYRKIINNLQVSDIKDNSFEILNEIPVLTREIIQNNMSDLIHLKEEKKLFKSSSSGTTGEPINYYHDVFGESAGNASGFLQWHMSGWKIGMKGIHIWGNKDSIKQWKSLNSRMKRYLQNVSNIPSPLFNDYNNYPDIINNFNKLKPDYIDGYSGSIYRLANYIEKNNIKFNKVKFVFTTAENLPDYQREIIMKNIGSVIDTYGCGEINGVASQIINNNKYFVIEPRVIVELGEKVGDFYEIVITDLDNLVMPFVKYKPGDLIDGLYYEDDGKLPFKYFNKIVGRTSDIIKLKNGKIILPVNLIGGTFIRTFKSITRHKVIWDGTAMHFLFESKENIVGELIKLKLNEILYEYEVPYTYEIVKEILPGKNGKNSYFEIINS